MLLVQKLALKDSRFEKKFCKIFVQKIRVGVQEALVSQSLREKFRLKLQGKFNVSVSSVSFWAFLKSRCLFGFSFLTVWSSIDSLHKNEKRSDNTYLSFSFVWSYFTRLMHRKCGKTGDIRDVDAHLRYLDSKWRIKWEFGGFRIFFFHVRKCSNWINQCKLLDWKGRLNVKFEFKEWKSSFVYKLSNIKLFHPSVPSHLFIVFLGTFMDLYSQLDSCMLNLHLILCII